MNNSAPIQRLDDITVRPLAPIIPLKSIPRITDREKKAIDREKTRDSRVKSEKNPPEFYNKPIYKPKKYDLL